MGWVGVCWVGLGWVGFNLTISNDGEGVKQTTNEQTTNVRMNKKEHGQAELEVKEEEELESEVKAEVKAEEEEEES